jgi:hypothetical protein
MTSQWMNTRDSKMRAAFGRDGKPLEAESKDGRRVTFSDDGASKNGSTLPLSETSVSTTRGQSASSTTTLNPHVRRDVEYLTIGEDDKPHIEKVAMDVPRGISFISTPYIFNRETANDDSYVNVEYPYISLLLIRSTRLLKGSPLIIYLWEGHHGLPGEKVRCVLDVKSNVDDTGATLKGSCIITPSYGIINDIEKLDDYLSVTLPLTITSSILLNSEGMPQ